MKIDLNGKWEFNIVNNDKWYAATVPGCNYLDLMANGIIADPFYGTNEKDLYWVSETDCRYKRTFEIGSDLYDSDRVLLVCKMLDTLADITVNGQIITSVNNCHIEHYIDIKEYVKIGVNSIEIYFKSPVNYVKKMQAIERCPNNCNGLTGIPHIRKPQCHFGWDWGPILTPSGISGDIYIESRDVAELQDVVLTQKHLDGVVELNVRGYISSYKNSTLAVNIEITEPNGNVIVRQIENIADSFEDNIIIDQPQLWWTSELSDNPKQPLYTVKVTIECANNIVSIWERKIGLRTIILNQNADKFGKNFQFVLNGKPIFAKGANWIPADSFINRVTKETLEFYIKSAVDSNFNMLRVWGGGYYESDTFYDLCDEYGLLVWQDFPFACQPYPFFIEEYRNQVLSEIEFNIKRLRDRASICLWCGNNEIESMAVGWATRLNYVKWTEKFFWDILPGFVAKFDSVTSYIAGTPVGTAHASGFNNDNVGDTHLWAVWHGLQPMTYYRRRMTRFCSEFGFESLPDLKSIKTFAEEKDYALASTVFSSHQKCASGNTKMAYYIASRFKLPKKFIDYIYLSQVCQQECIKDATEHWRRNKGQCNGSLYWQYNDCWPVCSWASVDYNRNYKALQYTAKHFFAPTMVSIENTKKTIAVYVVNDKIIEIPCRVECKLIDFKGLIYWKKSINLVADSNAVSELFSVNVKDFIVNESLKNCVFTANLYVNEQLINTKTVLFDTEKNIKLPKANINIECNIVGDKAVYTVKSDKFARLAALYSEYNSNPFSDNYFDILPNAELTVTQKLSSKQIAEKITAEQLAKTLSVKSVCDIEPKGSKFKDYLYRVKVFLTPINFFNWIYYQSIPAKIKVESEK